MDTTMEKAITLLLAHPETVDVGTEFRAEYDRVRWRATLAALGILVALLIVASVGAFFLTMWNDLDYLSEVLGSWLAVAQFVALPALVVIVVALAVMVWVRNLYVRDRMCAFLDARSDLSPEVAVARQAISTKPVEAVFGAVSVVGPILLVVVGLAWAGVIWFVTSAALDLAKNSKGM